MASTTAFEWEPRKAQRNLQLHGVSFEDAVLVFEDEWALLRFDREVDGEQRYHLTGSADGTILLVVVHTYRGDYDSQRIRIISARAATGRERKAYREALYSGEPLE